MEKIFNEDMETKEKEQQWEREQRKHDIQNTINTFTDIIKLTKEARRIDEEQHLK